MTSTAGRPGRGTAAGAVMPTGHGENGRDLTGYGGQWPDLRWPNGARLAVSLNINLEEGAEWQVGDGDPVSERMGEVISVVEPGTRDPGQEQIFAYGTRAGFWRMLEALEMRGMQATYLCCGRAVARSPALLAAALSRGHEAAVHGWLWRPHADYRSREDEAADLDRCIAAMTAAGGDSPAGFFCRGAESAWTRGLLIERGFAYTSNAFDDDLPYWDLSGARPLVVVPYALDSNDMKFFHPNGFVRAGDMVDYIDDALEVLLAEAARGRPRLLNIGYHLRIVGRPGRFAAFSRVLDRLAGLGDRVWVAPRAAIAEAFAAAVPAGS
ncbi:MAG: polysaccharide deacetylase family protein [Phreatobacter sp.]|uniref:polysaccharide deacetylase family protein n=1 Tax=Phreatobacter sp. TaxID=1966341 RepID=UPI0027368C80|nr:polysaccharide deacetylase family protein [Phreatobacter sp.]MDP2803403.1 polysaccharide deacetylase family protein [Phreatobacter sp.]